MGVNINKKIYISFGMVSCAGTGPSDFIRHRHDAVYFIVIYIIMRWRVERIWKSKTRTGEMYTDGLQVTSTWKIDATLFQKSTDSDQQIVNCL